MPFDNLSIRQLLAFCLKIIFLSGLCCVKAVSVEYKHIRFTSFQLAFTSAAKLVPMFVVPSLFRFYSILFFFLQATETSTGRKKFSSLAS